MEPLAFIVPAIASVALGGALLVPIRDGRDGRRATLGGRAPLFADFSDVVDTPIDDTTQPSHASAPEFEPAANPLVAGEVADVQHEARELVRSIAESETAIVRSPLHKLRLGLKRFLARSPVPSIDLDGESPTADDPRIERSFADELSLLLPIATPPGERTEDGQPSLVADATATVPAAPAAPNIEAHIPVDLRPPIARADRIVPLTRLPLRHQAKEIAWPATAAPPLSFANVDDRYAFLRACANDANAEHDALLAAAFREETPTGRALIMHALRRTPASPDAIDTFVDALATGSDEERAFAVDALSETGAREEVAHGLTDRIDAIAAKAALAYVGTTAREDYRSALAPFLEESRIETLLAMLAGIVE
jgi:hypothetical protein